MGVWRQGGHRCFLVWRDDRGDSGPLSVALALPLEEKCLYFNIAFLVHCFSKILTPLIIITVCLQFFWGLLALNYSFTLMKALPFAPTLAKPKLCMPLLI